eukprot:915356-Prymnesium_polylepis.1
MARRSTALCLPLLLGCSTAVRGAYLQHGAYGRAARRDRSASARLVAPTPPQPVIAGDAEAPEPMPVAKTGDEWLGSALAVRVDTVSAGVLDELRASAAAVVATAERPRRKDEAWRRTDLTSLFAAKLALPSGEVEEAAVGGVVEEPSAGMRLVLVDGAVSSDLSDLSALPDGVSVGSVGSLNAALASRVVEQLRSLPEEGADKRTELGAYTFAALNQARRARATPRRVAPVFWCPLALAASLPLRLCSRRPAAPHTPRADPPRPTPCTPSRRGPHSLRVPRAQLHRRRVRPRACRHLRPEAALRLCPL